MVACRMFLIFCVNVTCLTMGFACYCFPCYRWQGSEFNLFKPFGCWRKLPYVIYLIIPSVLFDRVHPSGKLISFGWLFIFCSPYLLSSSLYFSFLCHFPPTPAYFLGECSVSLIWASTSFVLLFSMSPWEIYLVYWAVTIFLPSPASLVLLTT